MGRSSGLDIADAIRFVSTKSFEIFEEHFTNILGRSGGAITTSTAGEIASEIAVGLMSPITEQLDPMRIGENQRAMNVAVEYGKLLGANPTSLTKLTMGYPAHGFVIDFDEIKREKLFPSVRRPTAVEDAFFSQLTQAIVEKFEENLLREPSDDKTLGFFLNPPQPIEESEHATNQPGQPHSGDNAPGQPAAAPAPTDQRSASTPTQAPVANPKNANGDGEDNRQQTSTGGQSLEIPARK